MCSVRAALQRANNQYPAGINRNNGGNIMVKLLTPDDEITAQVLPGYKLYWAQVDDPIARQTYNVSIIRELLKVYTVYSGAEIEQGYRRCGYHCQCLDAWRNFTNLDFTCSHVKQVE